MFVLTLCFGVMVACVMRTHALTTEELTKIHEALVPLITECGSQFGITMDKVKEAKQSGNIDDINPCFIACVFKKGNIMNEKGMFEYQDGQGILRQFVKGEEDLKKITEIAKECESVNKENVSDGEKGCERAQLLLKCFAKHKPAFGLGFGN